MNNIVKTELKFARNDIYVKKSMRLSIGKRFYTQTCALVLDNKPIEWVKEMKYLWLYILAALNFKCNLQYAKLSFFEA